ncbi:SDR family NAD(P)-dependent oxidoreductase [Pararhodobacter sp. SW119]|uniref:SDR family NAD(P)-dependent oxidoreductase n=1 Tax=Pararhodobacter sp. SW119 TaxID=2780075 RepID=UPI001ADEDC2E|nr:SDR family NAD(P)-dependent oxidoreductase [Pararhodobacter sp. SW119]
MRPLRGKRYWLVGASEGLGRALAERMSRAGVALVLSARSSDRLEELAATLPGPAEVLPMDVSDPTSVRAAAEKAGEVDGLVFLASVYWPQAARDWDPEQVETMLDVNLTGAARVLGAVVPAMVAHGAGHVVVTGSLAGYRGLPGAIGYGASKAGLMSLAESMAVDLKGTGVDVQLINPGYIRTRQTAKNDFTMPGILEPEVAAGVFLDHMRTTRFRLSFPFAFSLVFRLGRLLPDRLWTRVWARRS